MNLEIDEVSRRFGGLAALSGVTLRLAVGEILGVIGPNGSGKTTLVNIISGVDRASGGHVRFGEVALDGLPPHRLARLGIARTFQNVRVFREFTVYENVRVAASVAASDAPAVARVDALMEEFELSEWRDRLARTLPYGVQRRLEIARAVALQPRILLLDEPAAGLNEAESDELMHRIAGIRERLGCGILLIDHDMRLIMRTCERLAVLNDGELIAEGRPEDVRHDPAVIESYLG